MLAAAFRSAASVAITWAAAAWNTPSGRPSLTTSEANRVNETRTSSRNSRSSAVRSRSNYGLLGCRRPRYRTTSFADSRSDAHGDVGIMNRTYQLYIGGQWVESDGAEDLTVINPATE